MAIKVAGTTVVDDSRQLTNITAIDATTVSALNSAGIVSDIVADTTPQLGGNLDLNSNNITGTGNVDITGDFINTGNITTTGYIRGPASFTIDPAAHGDDTGTVIIAGNLQVDGTTTTINSTSVAVDDLNITLASGAANAAAANGAGLTVDGANATLTYVSTTDNWALNKGLDVTGTVSSDGLTVDGDGLAYSATNIEMRGDANVRVTLGTAGTAGANNSSNWVYGNGTNLRFNNAGGYYSWETLGSEVMRIDSSGNVGIGTSSSSGGVRAVIQGPETGGLPATSGTAQTYGLLRLQGTTFTSALDIGTNGGNGAWIQSTDQANLAQEYPLMLNPNGGNVGIGTSSPSQKLHVEGAGNQFILLNNSTTNDGFFFKAGAGASSIQTNGGSNVMNFFTSGSERMRIDSSGNLLVGTTNGNPTGNHEPGTLIFAGGQINVHRDGGNPARFGSSVDGNLTEYYKQGVLVGSIGTYSSTLYIASTDGSDSGLRFQDVAIIPCTTTGGIRDNAIDLGVSASRFKDLYLSGSISDGTNSATVADIVGGGGAAKAYVFYDMRTTLSVGQSLNVSSVSDQTTGRGRITFTSSFSDGEYVKTGSGGRQGNTTDCWTRVSDEIFNPTGSQVEMAANGNNGAEYDIQTNGGSFHGALA